jgi:cation diffusion facilitator family transporter
MSKKSKKVIVQAALIGLIVNLILSIIKLSFGFWGNASALISDGFNSFIDVFISLMLFIVLKLASKKPDYDHPYGHEKYEGIAYFVLGIIFLLTALFIGYFSVMGIIHYVESPSSKPSPHLFTVLVAFVSLIIKIALYKYYIVIGNKYQSATIKGDAKNHFIDAWATSASLIGLALAQTRFVIFDDIASLVIGFIILRLAIQILKDSISYLTDQSPEENEVHMFYQDIINISGVLRIDDLKIRKHMNRRFIDCEISVKSNLSLKSAHEIATNVHNYIEDKHSDVIHIMVHVNPFEE